MTLNYRAIKRLRDRLAEMSENRCYMGTWLATDTDGVPTNVQRRGTRDCGTTACLAGWAALLEAPTVDGTFADEFGKARVSDNELLIIPRRWAKAKHVSYQTPDRIVPKHRKPGQYVVASVSAIGRAALGLSRPAAQTLFYRHVNEETPDTVNLSDRDWMVWRLDKLLARKPRYATKRQARAAAKRVIKKHRKSLERLGR